MVKTLACLLLATSLTFADTQKPQNFSGDFVIKVSYSYLLSSPEGYEADTTKKWPLVIFLHGSGERGNDLEMLKKHGPPKLIAAGQKFPAVIASLQCPPNELWNPHGVKAITDHLIKTERIDASRVYLTGLSMGGFGTWETAFEYPDTYAAIAPICGCRRALGDGQPPQTSARLDLPRRQRRRGARREQPQDPRSTPKDRHPCKTHHLPGRRS